MSENWIPSTDCVLLDEFQHTFVIKHLSGPLEYTVRIRGKQQVSKDKQEADAECMYLFMVIQQIFVSLSFK